jgi:hypothetical protein
MVTNGVFDLTLRTSSGTLPAVPENAGSIVSATINGTAFNAWNGNANLGHLGDGLGFSSSGGTYTVSMNLPGVAAPGTYSLNQAAARFIHIRELARTASDPNCCWGGNAADVGTIVITSVTPARMQGTFSGTVNRSSSTGTASSLVITNGTFTIGR